MSRFSARYIQSSAHANCFCVSGASHFSLMSASLCADEAVRAAFVFTLTLWEFMTLPLTLWFQGLTCGVICDTSCHHRSVRFPSMRSAGGTLHSAVFWPSFVRVRQPWFKSAAAAASLSPLSSVSVCRPLLEGVENYKKSVDKGDIHSILLFVCLMTFLTSSFACGGVNTAHRLSVGLLLSFTSLAAHAPCECSGD